MIKKKKAVLRKWTEREREREKVFESCLYNLFSLSFGRVNTREAEAG